MVLQHLLHQSGSGIHLAAVEKHARPECSDQRMVRLQPGALIEFEQCVFVASLIHENARAVVAGDDQLGRIQAHHASETAQCAIILAIQTRQHTPHKVYTDVARILIAQSLNLFTGTLLFVAR